MGTAYEPLAEVRKSFRIPWYRCPVDREKLRELTTRSDLKGLYQALGHIALIAATGALTVIGNACSIQPEFLPPMSIRLSAIFYLPPAHGNLCLGFC